MQSDASGYVGVQITYNGHFTDIHGAYFLKIKKICVSDLCYRFPKIELIIFIRTLIINKL